METDRPRTGSAGELPAPEMFSNLLASRRAPLGRGAVAATSAALLFHAGLVGGLVWATLALGQEIADAEEEITYIEIPPEAPPPPPPDIPDAAPPPSEVVAEVPKGFLTITPPELVPTDIPPPITGVEFRASDFTGEGVEGGRGDGKAAPGNGDNIAAAPAFTPYTVAPELRNRDEVGRALRRNYPPLLRDAGIGGTVLVWLLIDEEGRVLKTQVQRSSGHDGLDQAALRVGDIMRFSAAMNMDRKVTVWVALPIVFTTS